MILIFLKNLQNQKNQSKKKKKVIKVRNTIILLNGRQKVLNAFENGIFSKEKQGKGLTSILDYVDSGRVSRVAKVFESTVSDRKQLKILTPKQMLQRLSIALAQVKTK